MTKNPSDAASAELRTILIIEDNPLNVRVFETILRHLGFASRTALCGREGIELARSHGFDLILLDLHLPDITGYEVIATLRAAGEPACVPIIVVSAGVICDVHDRVIAAGADACLAKPVGVAQLAALISDVLAAPIATGVSQ